MNAVRSTIGRVVPYMQHVQLDSDSADGLAASIVESGGLSGSWLDISPFDLGSLTEKERLGFLFALDAISFCYWGDDKWRVEYKDEVYDGAQAMLACLGRAVEDGMPVYDPHFLVSMQRDDMDMILDGEGQLKLVDERFAFLQELGRTVIDGFDGDYGRIVAGCGGDAAVLSHRLTEIFDCFKDVRQYDGKLVVFNKRAQLLAGDISSMVIPLDTRQLTGCADYKDPQVLRRENVFSYSPVLADMVDRLKPLPEGSIYEVEIRAATVFCVDMVRNRLRERGIECTSQDVNDHIWLLSQEKRPDDKPYHRTVTTSY
ncbi:queuosine salvage family protein [Candidatus Woesearchaeota archaeon]|nr:queuosine salvage family protein [Candidatus Woesearchaeota archaeon]